MSDQEQETEVPFLGEQRPDPVRRWVGIALRVLGVLALLGLLLVSWIWLFTDTSRSTDTVPDVTEVVVRVETGDVEFVAVERTDVEVNVRRRSSPLAEPFVDIRAEGQRLEIESRCQERVLPITLGPCRADLILTVPTTATIDVIVIHGDVAATGLAGPTRLRSIDGAVRIDSQAGDLQASTEGEPLGVQDLRGNTADLRSVSGAIEATVSAPLAQLSVTSQQGDVSLILPPGTYAVDATSDSGAIRTDDEILSDPANPAKVIVHTTSGDIRFEVPELEPANG